jgi:hypothetical protein
MVFGLIACDGKTMPPVFIKEGLKVKVKVYLGALEDHVIPWVKANYDDSHKTVFQQDGAPAHTSGVLGAEFARALIKREVASVLTRFESHGFLDLGIS